MEQERPPKRPKDSKRVLAPFTWFNWALEWVAYGLSGLAIFKVLEYAGKLTILSAAVFWITGASDREKADQRAAWSVVNAKGGGRREALEHLYSHGANLRGLNGVQAYFGDIDLHNADLRWADLANANLDGANLQGANLEGAHLNGVTFHKANLNHANLKKADLDRTEFDGADLANADMRGANIGLNGVIFDGATLSGADLRALRIFGRLPWEAHEGTLNALAEEVIAKLAKATVVDWSKVKIDDDFRKKIMKILDQS
jgi:Pentapeptide repeats (8 copies)